MTFDFDGFRAIRGHQLQGTGCSCFYSVYEDCWPGPGAKKALKPKRAAAKPIHLSMPGSLGQVLTRAG